MQAEAIKVRAYKITLHSNHNLIHISNIISIKFQRIIRMFHTPKTFNNNLHLLMHNLNRNRVPLSGM